MALSADQRRTFEAYFSGKQYAFATTLLVICGFLFGAEFLEWDPATLRMELYDVLGVSVPDEVMAKLQAGTTALTVDAVFDDAAVFHSVATALYDLDADTSDDWDNPDVEELAWAFTEIMLIRGEAEQPPISSDVALYTGIALRNQGFTKPPKQLYWAEMPTTSDTGNADTTAGDSYSDDPLMYQSQFGGEQDKVAEVEKFIDELFQKLLQQLHALPLGENWLKDQAIIEGLPQRH